MAGRLKRGARLGNETANNRAHAADAVSLLVPCRIGSSKPATRVRVSVSVSSTVV